MFLVTSIVETKKWLCLPTWPPKLHTWNIFMPNVLTLATPNLTLKFIIQIYLNTFLKLLTSLAPVGKKSNNN
jgi:hypothetical protein